MLFGSVVSVQETPEDFSSFGVFYRRVLGTRPDGDPKVRDPTTTCVPTGRLLSEVVADVESAVSERWPVVGRSDTKERKKYTNLKVKPWVYLKKDNFMNFKGFKNFKGDEDIL